MQKNVLVTGNLGYIGSAMVPFLVSRGYGVTGYDIGYYVNCYLKNVHQKVTRQIYKDIRDCTSEDFVGIDYVIHLAALSNDPLGAFNEALTYDINYEGTMKIAKCAKEAGVKRFIYTSSQSVYGISDTTKIANEESEKNPITAYAKTKWKCECELKKLCSDDFLITYLRPATAYGVSYNMRCDIVFNAFVAYAYTSRLIEIKSDGTPVRPMSHILDISSAFAAILEAPAEVVQNQVFNVGTNNNNYTISELARTVQSYVPGCGLIFTGEHTDPRSYRVSSDKILTILRDYYKPQWNIEKGCRQLIEFYKEIELDKETFEGWKCVRLKCLKKLIFDGVLDEKLRKIQ